jgi:ABC-2 type transport system ATP-binding protein
MRLEIRGLRHRYGRTQALVGVDLAVAAGECVALLGPNGAGKSTVVGCAIGLLPVQDGVVRLLGGDPRSAASRRGLGVVQQSLGFPTTLKVRELVSGAAVRGGRPAAAAGPVLAELGIAELAGQRAGKLSGGQKQRVQLAMALVTDPDLLVLDEPTNGLDVPTRRQLWDILARRRAGGVGVLVTTHLIEESAGLADRVVVVDQGQVLADAPPDELVRRLPDRTVSAATGLTDAQLVRLPGALGVRREPDLVRVQTRSPETLLRAWLAADPTLSGLRVQDAGLAEAVVALTTAAAERSAA